jgi:hypothetical protein
MVNIVLKWSGLVLCLIGALCTSLNITPINVYLLNLSALFYMVWSIRVRDLNLTLVNAGLLAIYCFGSVYRLFFA